MSMNKKPAYHDLEQRIKVLEKEAAEAGRLHAELRESEKKYRLLTEKMTDVVWITDMNLQTLYITPSARTVLGFNQEDQIPLTVEEQMTPESWTLAIETLAGELALEQQGHADPDRKVTLILEYYHKNGSTRWFETTIGGLRNDQGVLTGLHGVSRDVTERKLAEEALRKSEEVYTRLVNTIPDMIARTDLDGKILYVNDYTLQFSGYSREQLEGQNLLMFIASEDQERLIQNISLVMEGRKQGPSEYQMIMKGGRKVPFEVTGGVLRNEDGSPFGFVSECRDISERKRAEERLKKSEEKYRQLAETAHDLIVTVDLDFRITYVNKASLIYADGIDLIGMSLLAFTPPHLHSVQKEMMQKRREGFSETLAFEWELIPPSGKTLTFDIRASLLTDDGKPSGVLLIGRDSTERHHAEELLRQSEEKFRKVFISTPDCMAITRIKDGLIIDANKGFEEVTGWLGSEAIGKTSHEINFWSNPFDRDFMIEELKAGRDVLSREFQFRRKDGVVRSALYSVRSIQIAEDTCAIFSMQDITDLKRLEEDRQNLEQQLFHAQKMDAIGQLAGGVAHDFNNMLSVIIGNTEMAMRKVDSPEFLRNALEDTMNAAKRSADLTRQLLAFARKQTISPEVLDMNDMVTGMLKMLNRLIGENINLVWMPGRKLWNVRIDPSQVDQILVNLVVNARDAMNMAGKIIIETSNKICDETYCSGMPECVPGEYVLLTMSDDGCGMEKEVLANIFEPFFTTKNIGQGTGLGLATIYGIVKQNGGFINAYSEPGQGTTFRIYLPRYSAAIMESSDHQEGVEAQSGTETILIVEDEESVLKLSRDMLEILGYRVLTASKTDQAVRLVGEYDGNIDLLLTDIVMPDMNGKELSERIIPIKPGMKCLYMSGYTADVIARQGILDEGIKFISKPFSLRDLAAKVRETLE
ncbi:MAG: hypothetical protein CVU71_03565 [Deltaproteobacteria bacterium HGW-Deltaproteobacteria-6]|nr:MAG: hypothetical protein CVU71_03565 [Deltaproteobacteria bacterium HGW-Deltaproteobacteria-6]